MIRGALKRTLVTEMYARIVLLVLSAIAGSIGLAVSGHSVLSAVLGIAAMAAVYRLKYGRW